MREVLPIPAISLCSHVFSPSFLSFCATFFLFPHDSTPVCLSVCLSTCPLIYLYSFPLLLSLPTVDPFHTRPVAWHNLLRGIPWHGLARYLPCPIIFHSEHKFTKSQPPQSQEIQGQLLYKGRPWNLKLTWTFTLCLQLNTERTETREVHPQSREEWNQWIFRVIEIHHGFYVVMTAHW